MYNPLERSVTLNRIEERIIRPSEDRVTLSRIESILEDKVNRLLKDSEILDKIWHTGKGQLAGISRKIIKLQESQDVCIWIE